MNSKLWSVCRNKEVVQHKTPTLWHATPIRDKGSLGQFWISLFQNKLNLSWTSITAGRGQYRPIWKFKYLDFSQLDLTWPGHVNPVNIHHTVCISWYSLATGTIYRNIWFPAPEGVFWDILPQGQYFLIHALGWISDTHPCTEMLQ